MFFYVPEKFCLRLRNDHIWFWPFGGTVSGVRIPVFTAGRGDHGAGILVHQKKIRVISLSIREYNMDEGSDLHGIAIQ